MYRGKNAVFEFTRSVLKEYDYCRNVMKHFNKNLVMTVEEIEKFKRSNTCWISAKLIDFDNKVRDHCPITRKYRGVAQLKISKNVPVIFHNLKGYDSHLIFKELSKYNCKVIVIPNGLEST